MRSSASPTPIAYLLPTTSWAALLEIIAQDAPPGSVIEVQTEQMQQLSLAMLARYSRTDVTVQLQLCHLPGYTAHMSSAI